MRRAGRCPAQDEQEHCVGDRRPDPVPDPGERVAAAYGATGQAGHQHDSRHHDGKHDQETARGTLAEERPRREGHEQHLQVAEHCGDPSSDRGDGVVPQHEIHAQEHPRQDCGRADSRPPGPMPPLLRRGQRHQHRQRQEAAEERGGGGAGVGKLDKHRRGRDAGRAEGGHQQRPAGGDGPASLVAGNDRAGIRC